MNGLTRDGTAKPVSLRNVLICCEAPVPVTCRQDVALEDGWHEEVGTVGLNHIVVSRLAQ